MNHENNRPWVVIRGAGDLATGIIVRLHRCGFRLLVTECREPSAIRRAAALCSAVWAGSAEVEGVVCRRADSLKQAEEISAAGEIPLLVDEQAECASLLGAACVVDAILAKRNLGTHRGMAPITVGVGPGFTAGGDVDAVVETMRGHQLGRVIRQGSAIPNTGIPGNVGGETVRRVMHAPADGIMTFIADGSGQTIDIGAVVQEGQTIAMVGDTPLTASLSGVLRGLIREGFPVTKGLKIADIDPRLEQVNCCDTVSDKARAIGGGVLEAILTLSRERNIPLL